MKLTVKLPDEEVLNIVLEPSDSIGKLKSEIMRKTGVPEYLQRLILNSQQLDDINSLSKYNISDTSVIEMWFKIQRR